MKKIIKKVVLCFIILMMIGTPIAAIKARGYVKSQRIEEHLRTRMLSFDIFSVPVSLDDFLKQIPSEEYKMEQSETSTTITFNSDFMGADCEKFYNFSDGELWTCVITIADVPDGMPENFYGELLKIIYGEPDEFYPQGCGKIAPDNWEYYVWYGKNGLISYTKMKNDGTIKIQFMIH